MGLRAEENGDTELNNRGKKTPWDGVEVSPRMAGVVENPSQIQPHQDACGGATETA